MRTKNDLEIQKTDCLPLMVQSVLLYPVVIRVPLKTALNRENEMIAPNARKGSESLLTQGEET